MASSEPDPAPGANGKQNGKLSIPLPFEDALRAATEIPASKLPPPNGKPRKRPRKPAKG